MNALIIVDVQNDFCPNGKLAVPGGDEIVPVINSLAALFDSVILTQDWHPSDHSSFASTHEGKNEYELTEMPYGSQVLWPDHCIQGSEGADFHPSLDKDRSHIIIRKGFRKDIDSYSGFLENDQKTKTGLEGVLKSIGIKKVFVCGLATDFCVKWTALDAIATGFDTYLIEDASRGIDLNGSLQEALNEITEAGVHIVQSSEISSHL